MATQTLVPVSGIVQRPHTALSRNGHHLLHGNEPFGVRPRKTHSHGVYERETRRNVEMPRKHTQLPCTPHPDHRARVPVRAQRPHQPRIEFGYIIARHL